MFNLYRGFAVYYDTSRTSNVEHRSDVERSICHTPCLCNIMHSQRAYDVIITSLLRQNEVTVSFWRYNDAIITSCVRRAVDISPKVHIYKVHGPTWGPPGSCRPQMGPMLVPWTLLSGYRMPIAFVLSESGIGISRVRCILNYVKKKKKKKKDGDIHHI